MEDDTKDALEKALENQKKLVREEVKRQFDWGEDNYVPHLYDGPTDHREFKMPVEYPGFKYFAYFAHCVHVIRVNRKEVKKINIRVITKPLLIFKFRELGMLKLNTRCAVIII